VSATSPFTTRIQRERVSETDTYGRLNVRAVIGVIVRDGFLIIFDFVGDE